MKKLTLLFAATFAAIAMLVLLGNPVPTCPTWPICDDVERARK